MLDGEGRERLSETIIKLLSRSYWCGPLYLKLNGGIDTLAHNMDILVKEMFDSKVVIQYQILTSLRLRCRYEFSIKFLQLLA